MAHKATTWAWEAQGLTMAQKFLLVALADMADEEYSCFPGQGKLAEMVGAKKRSVLSNLAELERLGYIVRTRRHRGDGSRTSDRFVLQVGHAHDLGASDAPPDAAGLGASDASQGASDDTSKVHLTTDLGAPDALEENHQLTTRRNHQKESPDARARERFEVAWKHWPKKTEKKLSLDRFLKAERRRPQLMQEVIAFGDAYAATTDVQYVPALCAWINRERWSDPLPQHRGGSKQDEHLALIARARAQDAAEDGSRRALAG